MEDRDYKEWIKIWRSAWNHVYTCTIENGMSQKHNVVVCCYIQIDFYYDTYWLLHICKYYSKSYGCDLCLSDLHIFLKIIILKSWRIPPRSACLQCRQF